MPDISQGNAPESELPRQDSPRTHRIDPSALAKLLEEWTQGDETEQRETFEYLRRALDEDRPPGYKLFS
jgi:hypothetical protein